jgi:glycosyltransferase involved in cell wall biosynthesis
MTSKPAVPSISVCIPAYNEEKNIGKVLEFLRAEASRTPGLNEVLVDVSGSTDRTAQIVSRVASTWNVVTMVDVGERDGLLRALDRLMQLSKGDIVVRMDADIHPRTDTITRLLAALTGSRAGIVGPRVVVSMGHSRIVNRISAAEWELHHQVSLRHPKTTLLQVFRRETAHLPTDAGAEDAALQEVAERIGQRAIYAEDAIISVMPPSNLRALLLQRIRTIQALRLHVKRGHTPPATASPRIVTRAVAQVIRDRSVPLADLLSFLLVESSARAWAVLGSVVPGTSDFVWAPVDGTKDIDWGPTVERSRPVPDRY